MSEEDPLPRPRDTSPQELGFTPQPTVPWLAPKVLIRTGIKVLIANIFGSYADKRELQGILPARVHRYTDDEMWLDYVADIGDGFDATYSVATLLARPSLSLPGLGQQLPRGRLLIMGGDEVYPHASITDYENRTKGVYRAALPAVEEGQRPSLLALPGNHDWYDGLTAFLRIFAQGRPFGGWQTEQTRSYFAAQLPHRWWLFAVDTQFDDYLDAPQLGYFRKAAAEVKPDDAIILCTPNPVWVTAEAPGGERGYDIVAFFEEEILRPTGAQVRLMIAGNMHHYSRYAQWLGGRQHITCGLGGAYLTATHELPDRVDLPPPTSRLRQPGPRTRFHRISRYPRKFTSEVFAAGILQLPFRNPGFWAMMGISQTLMTLTILFGLAGPFGGQGAEFFLALAGWTPAVVVGALVALAALAFAHLDSRTPKLHARLAGGLHAACHVILNVGWALFILWLHTAVLPASWFTAWFTLLLAVVVTPVAIGLLHAELVAVYLLIVSRFNINLNEVMAGQTIEDHKGFLRLHIGPDGSLTVYPIVLPKICRVWEADPDGARGDPWLKPVGTDLRPTFIEQPIVIARSDDDHAPSGR